MGWTGAIAQTGRAQAASLYNLAYYLGSSILAGPEDWCSSPSAGRALAAAVIILACATAVITAVVHPSSRRQRRQRQPDKASLQHPEDFAAEPG